jgi:hypothetical protein
MLIEERLMNNQKAWIIQAQEIMVITEYNSSEMYAQSLVCLIMSKTAKLVKKCTEHKMCVLFLCTNLFKTFFTLIKV